MEVIHDPVPANLTRLFDGTNWEEYMEGVFKFVADEGGSYDIIAEKIRELKPTEGKPNFHLDSSNLQLINICEWPILFILNRNASPPP